MSQPSAAPQQIYLVRHGETEWSQEGRHTSVTDLDLTDRGRAQARALRTTLDPDSFQLVLCSPRLRARRTAELAGFDPARTVIDDDLAEWCYGDYEGRTSPEIHLENPGWSIWTAPTPGGETADQVRARLTRVINRIVASGAERAICFAHAHSLRVMTLTWLDISFRHGDQFPLETTAISVLGEFKDNRALLRWNEF